SVNANLRLYRKLLALHPPTVSDRLALPAIVATVLDSLSQSPPPNGPVFGSTAVPPEDTCEDLWAWQRWTEHLVTALAYHRHSFLLHGQPASNNALQTTTDPEARFKFEPPPVADSRHVNGATRRRLFEVFSKAGDAKNASGSRTLARIAMFLPNANDSQGGK